MTVTWLFVPGDRSDRFAKAAASGADEIIIDLEDGVVPARKVIAREAAASWLASGSAWVRVNAAGTPWHADDIAALIGAPRLRGIVIPKADRSVTFPDRVPIVALIESASGIAAAREIAACPAVSRLAFGSLDYAIDIDATDSRDALLLARSTLVLASRLAGLPPPIDGVTSRIDDIQGVTADARYARELGFGGKLCIHPRQVGPVAAAFAPSPDEVAWAERVLSAAPAGAAQIDGTLVDEPVLIRARRIVERARGKESRATA